jgi:hypothetical protein
MAKIKALSVGLLALMIFSMFAAAGVSPVAAGDTVYTNTATFDDYFKLVEINGTVDDTTPALVFNTTAEYFDFNVTITPNAGNSTIIEIPVPDGYMGLDLWEGVTTLKTGTANYTLSVPYDNNSTDVPALDWLALTAANGTGSNGIAKRVQLISNQTAATALTIRVYYATAPAVGFDGVNDYVQVNDAADSQPSLPLTFNLYIKLHRTVLTYKSISGVYQGYSVGSGNNAMVGTAYNSTTKYNTDSSGTVLSYGSVKNYTMVYDGVGITMYDNGTADAATSFGPDLRDSTSAFVLSSMVLASPFIFYGQLVNTVSEFNASSFSGGASTTVDDFSASENDGVAYGGVQYKNYLGTGFAFTVDDDAAPTYDNVAYNTTTIGLPCLFSARWADDFPLAGYILSYDNGTGSMANETWAALSGTLAWANVTKTLNATGGTTIRYQWFCNDSVGNWNSTALLNFTTVAPSVTPVVTLSTLYTGYHAGDTVTFVSKITANGVPQESINLTLYINGTMLNGTTDALGIYSYDLDYPGGETTAVASLVSNWWQESEYRYLLAANSSTITVTSGVTNMEGTYVGVYVAFLAVAFACFAFSMKSWDTWMPSFLFPATSAVLWSILSVLSFSVYTDTLTSWNLWMISPLCVIFAFASVLVTAYRAFDSLRQASAIQVDEE